MSQLVADPWKDCNPRCVGYDDCLVAPTCLAQRNRNRTRWGVETCDLGRGKSAPDGCAAPDDVRS